jgi:hypothetical protein
VLHSLIASRLAPVVDLREIFRQAAESAIITSALAGAWLSRAAAKCLHGAGLGFLAVPLPKLQSYHSPAYSTGAPWLLCRRAVRRGEVPALHRVRPEPAALAAAPSDALLVQAGDAAELAGAVQRTVLALRAAHGQLGGDEHLQVGGGWRGLGGQPCARGSRSWKRQRPRSSSVLACLLECCASLPT